MAKIRRMCTEYRGGAGTLPETQGNASGDVGTRLAGHDTGPQGPHPPNATGVTAALPGPPPRGHRVAR